MPSASEPTTTFDTNPPSVWLLMGVCGCGKTAVGELLARRLGGRFVDADALHPPENVAKMSAKIPLTDADRQPWLEKVRREVIDSAPPGTVTVLGCSALKHSYRRVLMDGAPGVRLFHLHGPRELIAARLAARKGHFMPPELLTSQLATLEAPDATEGLTVSIDGTLEEVADRCLRLAEEASSRSP